MRMRYIPKIQANMKRQQRIFSNRTSSNVLDGSYRSIYKGKSMNFDELREYVAGDNIKDMDWKASARSRKLLVRQYVAEKKHNILFVMDTNKSMLGHSEGLEEKAELAIMSAGTLGYMADGNGDYVGTIMVTNKGVKMMPFKTGLGNLESLLELYQKEVSKGHETDINLALDYVVRHFRKKMIIVLVTDLEGISRISDINLKRVLVANDVLVMNISDMDFQKGKMFDIKRQSYVSDFFAADKKLVKRARERKLAMAKACEDKLNRYGVSHATFDGMYELDKEIVNLLTKHKLDKK